MAVLAAHLRAGRSLRQAIEEGAADLPQPAAERLDRAARAVELGASPATALELIGSGPDVRAIAAAAALQAQHGGDLVALFEGVAEVLVERAALRRSAAVATAQARATGRIVAFMPLGGLAALWLADRPALWGLLSSPLGWFALVVSGGLVLLGLALIGRIAAVDP